MVNQYPLPLSLYPSAAMSQHCNHSASESGRISGEARVPRGANGPRQQMAGPYGMGNWSSSLPAGRSTTKCHACNANLHVTNLLSITNLHVTEICTLHIYLHFCFFALVTLPVGALRCFACFVAFTCTASGLHWVARVALLMLQHLGPVACPCVNCSKASRIAMGRLTSKTSCKLTDLILCGPER